MIPFPNKKYEIVYADPPWDAPAGRMGSGGEYKRPYPCMKMNEIAQLPIETISENNCLLFLWVISPELDKCIHIGREWGFIYSTVGFVWDKQHTLYGNYTLPSCELCLIYRKGKIPQPRGERIITQFLSIERGKHSVKPNEVRKRIEYMFPSQSKIELFARKTYPGWDAWGNEVNLVDNPDQSDIKHVEQIKLF